MTYFIPGKNVAEFTSKKHYRVIVRYPRWEDLDGLTEYINALSRENTFINFSGEKISKKDETKFLADFFANLENNDKVILLAKIDHHIGGICMIDRDLHGRKRTHHVGIFGISIANKYRGSGIGYLLAKTAIDEAKKKLKLKMLVLGIYEGNTVAKRLYYKLGFKDCGLIPEGILYKGKYIGHGQMYLSLV